MTKKNLYKPPRGVNKLKWKLLLLKAFFERGYGITGFIKYFIALFGISSLNVSLTMTLGFVYAISCFIIGYIWYSRDFTEIENEIANRFNRFVVEMRKKMK